MKKILGLCLVIIGFSGRGNTNEYFFVVEPQPKVEVFAYVHNISPSTNYSASGVIFSQATNVEFVFTHEPIIVGTTNGEWIVRFK